MTTHLICWDSAVLIDCIRDDETVSGRKQEIKTVIDYVENNPLCKWGFSTLVYAEVLESKRTEESVKQFKGFMRREQVEVIAVSKRVAEKAGKIRDKSPVKLSTPDAIHLATAIIVGAKVFHTFDDQLLRLDGKEEVNGLSITACKDLPPL